METIWESRWLLDYKQILYRIYLRGKPKRFFYGGLAQLGEHLPCKQGVESSNLLVSSCNYCITDSDCRTYLENRILKIQNNEKTSEVKLFIE